MTFEEIVRLARLFVERYEVDGLRLTGGEPTVRAHLPVLVAQLAELRVPATSASPYAGRKPDLSVTTNGATLRLIAADLRAAGLDRMNISLDTLRRDRFAEITRRDELDRVLDGIEAAKEAGFTPVKINAVIERGVNDDEVVDLAEFGRDHGVEVRFIEFMPLDADGHWANQQVVSQDEIVATIAAVHPLVSVPARGAAPADTWRYADGRGTVGVIPTVTKPFCGDCDRVRLTADGRFRTCLFATDDHDLLSLHAPWRRRRRAGRGHRARRRHEVGGPHDQHRQLRPPGEVDEPDRRLAGRLAVTGASCRWRADPSR